MGTQLDLEYSRYTKSRLLEMCNDAPNPRLIDIGTGDGDLWEFAPTSLQWHGIDISGVGIRQACNRFPRLRAAVAITERLPYPTNFFGLAVAADTIEHVFAIEETLGEINRVVAPGGKFVLSVPTPDSLRKWAHNRLLRQLPSFTLIAKLLWILVRRKWLFGSLTFQPIDRDLKLDEWLDLLRTADFQVEKVEEWPTSPFTPIVYLIETRVRYA